MLTSTFSVSKFMLNIEFCGISVFPFKMFPATGLILGPKFGSLYRYNAIEAGSGQSIYIKKISNAY